MFWTIFWVVYLAGAMVFFIPSVRIMMEIMDADVKDKAEVVMAISIAMSALPFWPLFIPGWWAYKLITVDHSEDDN